MNIGLSGLGGTNVLQQAQTAALQRDQNQQTEFSNILESAMQATDSQQKRAAAEEMESFFINMLFTEMRRSVPEPQGLFERSNAEKIFEDMKFEEIANQLAASGGLGIADMVYEDLTRVSRANEQAVAAMNYRRIMDNE